jgi:hypothetical protein
MPLHLRPERLDLAGDPRVLVGDAVDGLDPAQQVVQARCAEDDVERRGGRAGRVDGDEAPRERLLRVRVVRARDGEGVTVPLQVALDLLQLVGRGVVGLDRALEARVDLLDLPQDPIGLGFLRRNRPGIRGRRARGQKSR